MKFCSTCGSPRIELRVPDGDTHARHVCAECGRVHYVNPKVVVGCLPEWEHRILLCRRAIEPRYGLWTLPAGFLEIGESVVAGAARETLEEANARVEVGELYSLVSLPQIGQVYMMFRARLLRPRLRTRHGEPRGAAVRGARGAVGGARVPHHRPDAAQLLPRSQAWCVPAARVVARTTPAARAVPARSRLTRGGIQGGGAAHDADHDDLGIGRSAGQRTERTAARGRAELMVLREGGTCEHQLGKCTPRLPLPAPAALHRLRRRLHAGAGTFDRGLDQHERRSLDDVGLDPARLRDRVRPGDGERRIGQRCGERAGDEQADGAHTPRNRARRTRSQCQSTNAAAGREADLVRQRQRRDEQRGRGERDDALKSVERAAQKPTAAPPHRPIASSALPTT